MPNYSIENLDQAIEREIERVSTSRRNARSSLDNYFNIFNSSDSGNSYNTLISDDLDWGDDEIGSDEDYEDEDSEPYDAPPVASGRPYVPRSSRPRHNLEQINLDSWNYETSEEAIGRFYQTLEYRIKWIFDREEREGFVRRQVSPFSIQEFESKVAKQKNKLNTDSRRFYDWKLGGVDFLLRLEKFEQDNNTYLRVHVLDEKNNNKQLCYINKVWNGEKFYNLNYVWAERN